MFHLAAIDLRIILTFGFAGGITFFLIPSIVEIAQVKSLYAVPGERGSQKNSVPNLGGIAIFLGTIISYLFFLKISYFPAFQFILAGVFTLFFVGFKDDITHIPPFKKFFGQIIAAWIVVALGGIRITNLYGFFGITELQESLSYLISIIAIVGIINSFNLMDGIDGLCAGLGILASLAFDAWFYLEGDYNWVMLVSGLTGSLLAFSYFNVFGKTFKIIMGDTGSLTIGLTMSVVAIHFSEMNLNPAIPFHIHSAPSVAIALLMLPVFDSIRVILNRMARHRSPFEPDRTHIHHHLLDLGFTHLKATLILLGISLFFIGVGFLIKDLTVFQGLIILLGLGVIKTYVIGYLTKKKGVTRDAKF
jgi:UDP-N-acetylmuramyl pentapeptide phosphotransferase/UDP-N-acetylglucosamine-1-phosphate transferase